MKGRLVLAGTPSELKSIRAQKVIATALYASIPLALQNLKEEEVTTNYLLAQKSLVLTFHNNDDGATVIQVGTTNAMMRLIASLAPTSYLLGKTWSDNALVSAWVDFGWNSLEVPLECVVSVEITISDGMKSAIEEDFGAAFQILDDHLRDKTYVVGEAITLADISLVFAVYKARASSDDKTTIITTNMDRWMEFVTNQEFFQRALELEPIVDNVVR